MGDVLPENIQDADSAGKEPEVGNIVSRHSFGGDIEPAVRICLRGPGGQAHRQPGDGARHRGGVQAGGTVTGVRQPGGHGGIPRPGRGDAESVQGARFKAGGRRPDPRIGVRECLCRGNAGLRPGGFGAEAERRKAQDRQYKRTREAQLDHPVHQSALQDRPCLRRGGFGRTDGFRRSSHHNAGGLGKSLELPVPQTGADVPGRRHRHLVGRANRGPGRPLFRHTRNQQKFSLAGLHRGVGRDYTVVTRSRRSACSQRHSLGRPGCSIGHTG